MKIVGKLKKYNAYKDSDKSNTNELAPIEIMQILNDSQDLSWIA